MPAQPPGWEAGPGGRGRAGIDSPLRRPAAATRTQTGPPSEPSPEAQPVHVSLSLSRYPSPIGGTAIIAFGGYTPPVPSTRRQSLGFESVDCGRRIGSGLFADAA